MPGDDTARRTPPTAPSAGADADPDVRALVEEAPGGVLVLRPDTPGLTILAATVRHREAAGRAGRRAAAVLDRVADAHVTPDRDFRVVAVNPAAERAPGPPRDALLGRTHWEAFPASVDADAGRAYRRVVAEGIEQPVVQHYVGEGYDVHPASGSRTRKVAV